MRILAAAIQMPTELSQRAANLGCADAFLCEASRAGVDLVVLPEMYNTGYGVLRDYAPHAEGGDGPTLRHLSARSRQWRMGIVARLAAGVEARLVVSEITVPDPRGLRSCRSMFPSVPAASSSVPA